MLFLALHIVGNAAFALLVKAARTHRFDYAVVGLANYATAAAIASAALLVARLPAVRPEAAVLGAVNGAQYQVTYLLMYALLGMAGIAVTSGFLRLSVAVPVLASIVVWQERPTLLQATGLVLAGAALPLLGRSAQRTPSPSLSPSRRMAAPRGVGRRRVALLVAVTLLVSGSGLLAAKAFAELGSPEQRPVYVCAVYLAATTLSVVTWPLRDRLGRESILQPMRLSIAFGALVGAVNVAQMWALLPALSQLPGVVALPVAAAGGLAVTALGGWLIWREPLGGATGAGLGLAIVATALANAG
jgi:drug/metabolite transporter (DMT)-like permease